MSNKTEVTIEKTLSRKIWIETDIMNSHHIMMQLDYDGAPSFCFASLNYSYEHVDNASLKKIATEFAIKLGAIEPIEIKARDFVFKIEKED